MKKIKEKKSRVPNFMLIGAAKSGTTSLHHYLSQHPQVFLPVEKELQFFIDDSLFLKGKDFYCKQYFSNSVGFHAIGEATPLYLHKPDIVIPRIKKMLGDTRLKFIVILRSPVKRAWSHYLHMTRLGLEIETFEKAIKLEAERLKARPESWVGYFQDGLYARQLNIWFDAFGRSSFFVTTQEELRDDAFTVLQSIYRFLDVDSSFNVQDMAIKNAAGEARSKWILSFLMGNGFSGSVLKAILPIPFRRKWGMHLRHLLMRRSERAPVLENAIELRLRRMYEPDIVSLEQMLGRSFDAWRETPERDKA